MLVYRDSPLPFSVVTVSICELLVISKVDLFSKFPKDMIHLMEERAKEKLNWTKSRLVDICTSVENVAKWGNVQEDFNEKVADVARRYPKATHQAMTSFMTKVQD